jgi:hypothetical protein
MFQDPTKKFIKYRVDWKPNKFEVFWNNIKVRTFEDKLLMEEFNQLKGRVRVLINTNVLREYNPSTKEKSHYLVKYFNFSSLDELIS